MRRTFYILTIVLLAVLTALMLIYDKGTLHLLLCDHHTAAGDVFFPAYTKVAEWGIYIVVIALLFYKVGWATFLLGSSLIAGGVGQIIKHIAHAPRPVTWFAEHYPDVCLPAIEGIPFRQWNSFPSGHTITFFCLFLVLTMIIEEILHSHHSAVGGSIHHSTSLLLFFLASLGAYSRIYMSMHFAEDVFAGIIIGVVVTGLLSLILPKLQNTKFWNVSISQSIQTHR